MMLCRFRLSRILVYAGSLSTGRQARTEPLPPVAVMKRCQGFYDQLAGGFQAQAVTREMHP